LLSFSKTVAVHSNTATLGSLNIDAGGTLNFGGAYNLNLTGNFTNNGAFNAANSAAIFQGGPHQYLVANNPTSFNNLTVQNGVTLIEYVSSDNVTVSGTLTNDGVIRKTQAVSGAGDYSFGLAGGRSTRRTWAFTSTAERSAPSPSIATIKTTPNEPAPRPMMASAGASTGISTPQAKAR
jgi:hypothetical protein